MHLNINLMYYLIVEFQLIIIDSIINFQIDQTNTNMEIILHCTMRDQTKVSNFMLNYYLHSTQSHKFMNSCFWFNRLVKSHTAHYSMNLQLMDKLSTSNRLLCIKARLLKLIKYLFRPIQNCSKLSINPRYYLVYNEFYCFIQKYQKNHLYFIFSNDNGLYQIYSIIKYQFMFYYNNYLLNLY